MSNGGTVNNGPTHDEVDAIIKDIAANPRKQNRKNVDLTFVIIKLLHDNEANQQTIINQGKEIIDLKKRLQEAEERANAVATNLEGLRADTAVIRQDVERRQKEQHIATYNKEKEETSCKIVIRKLPQEEGETYEDLRRKVSDILNTMKLRTDDCDFENVKRIPKSKQQKEKEENAMDQPDARPPLPPLVVMTLRTADMKTPFFKALKHLKGSDFQTISCMNEVPRCVRPQTAEMERKAKVYRDNHPGHKTRVFYEDCLPIVKYRTKPTEKWTKVDL